MAEAARGLRGAQVRPSRLPAASVAGCSRHVAAAGPAPAPAAARPRPHQLAQGRRSTAASAARLAGDPRGLARARPDRRRLPAAAGRPARPRRGPAPPDGDRRQLPGARSTTLGATARPGLVIAPAVARDALRGLRARRPRRRRAAAARRHGRPARALEGPAPVPRGVRARVPRRRRRRRRSSAPRCSARRTTRTASGGRSPSSGSRDRVEFLGFRDDVWRELARLDVLVHASVIPEPFGQVVVEGMAAGLPVLAAAAGGPAEIIEDGVDGVHVPPGYPEALAAALRRLAADPARRRRLGDAARRSARRYAPERTAEQMRGAYRMALAVSRARRSPAPGASRSGAARPGPAAASTPRAGPRPSPRPAGR